MWTIEWMLEDCLYYGEMLSGDHEYLHKISWQTAESLLRHHFILPLSTSWLSYTPNPHPAHSVRFTFTVCELQQNSPNKISLVKQPLSTLGNVTLSWCVRRPVGGLLSYCGLVVNDDNDDGTERNLDRRVATCTRLPCSAVSGQMVLPLWNSIRPSWDAMLAVLRLTKACKYTIYVCVCDMTHNYILSYNKKTSCDEGPGWGSAITTSFCHFLLSWFSFF